MGSQPIDEPWLLGLHLCHVQAPTIAGEVDMGEVSGCRDDELRQHGLRRSIASVGHETPDDLLQGLAVAHREGLTLRLTMVGEDDQSVRPIGTLGRGVDGSKRIVDMSQGVEGRRMGRSCVVADLVVGRERGVDQRSPALELSQQRSGGHLHERPLERRAHDRDRSLATDLA